MPNINNKIFYPLERKREFSLNERLKPFCKVKTNDKTKVYSQFKRKKAVHKK